jgi:hypothetical protein
LFYKTDTDILYVSDGTQFNLVANANPSTTGGTVTITALSESGTFSYNLGIDFADDVDTDAQLTYTLSTGTMPSGCTLPTSGNTAFTGTASTVLSNTNYTWVIKATDTSGGTATQNYQQTINTVAATVTGGTVTITAVDEGGSASYDVDTDFTFGTGSTFSAFSLQSGALPGGLSLNTSTGVISGTMSDVSSTTAYTFTIRGTDTDGDTADQAYSWSITNVPFSATGGTITYSGLYTIHTFTASSTFVANSSGNADYLVVAGGGGGGSHIGGGAGAGGMLTATSVNINIGNHTITIGAGGGGSTNTNGLATNGGDTVFGTIATATGGGHGGSGYSGGGNGGSGGGVGHGSGSGGATPGTGVTGQGYGGGNGNQTGAHSSGGGGGKTAIGATGVQGGKAGDGGAGQQWTLDGNSYYYAGGGGGGGMSAAAGHGGIGGGGGGTSENTTDGNGGGSARNNGGVGGGDPAGNGGANTGGGGGGGGHSNMDGGAGGSGIVIIRYLT